MRLYWFLAEWQNQTKKVQLKIVTQTDLQANSRLNHLKANRLNAALCNYWGKWLLLEFPPPSIWMFYWIASRSWEFKKPANWREYQTIQDLWEFVPCMRCYNRAEKEKFMSTGNIVNYTLFTGHFRFVACCGLVFFVLMINFKVLLRWPCQQFLIKLWWHQCVLDRRLFSVLTSSFN